MDENNLKNNTEDSLNDLQAALDNKENTEIPVEELAKGEPISGDLSKQVVAHKTAPPPENLPSSAEGSSGLPEVKEDEAKLVPPEVFIEPDKEKEVEKVAPSLASIPANKTVVKETIVSPVIKPEASRKDDLPVLEPVRQVEVKKSEPSVYQKIIKEGGEEKKEQNPKKKNIIRTYQGDIAEALKRNNGSVTKIAMAEQKKKQDFKDSQRKEKKTRLGALLGSLTLLLFGIFALSYVVFFAPKNDIITDIKGLEVNEIVFSEIKKEVDSTSLNKEKLIEAVVNEIRTSVFRLDYIEHVVFTRNRVGLGGEIIKSVLPTRDFFALVTDRLPPALLRSFNGDYMFGIHAFNGNTPFIIVDIDFFENAFAGMLKWETFMADDLFPLFGVDASRSVKEKRFKDLVFKNYDIRVLTDEVDRVLLAYAFTNKNVLIITTDIDTFEELINKLNTPKPITQ